MEGERIELSGGLGMMMAMLAHQHAHQRHQEEEDDDDEAFPIQFGLGGGGGGGGGGSRKRALISNGGNGENKRSCIHILNLSESLQEEMTKLGMTNAESVASRIFPDEDDVDLHSREFFIEKLGLKKTSSLDVVSVIFADLFPDPRADCLLAIANVFVNDKLVSPDERATPAFYAKILLFFKLLLTQLENDE